MYFNIKLILSIKDLCIDTFMSCSTQQDWFEKKKTWSDVILKIS